MSQRRYLGWLHRRTAARAAAGFAVLAMAPVSAAQAAPASPYVFAGTRTELTPGPNNGTPGVVAIGDLHSATARQEAVNAFLCHPGFSFPALPGCQSDIAVIGEQDYGTAFLKDARDSRVTSAGVFDGLSGFGNLASSAGIGDFNGDGANDLAVADPQSDAVVIVNGTGNGQFGNTQYIPIPFQTAASGYPYVSSLAVGDLGNGHPDIALAVAGSPDGGLDNVGAMIVMMNNGHGQFTQTTYPAGNVPADIVIGDLGNGRPDIALASAGLGNQFPPDPGVNLYMNNGHGSFTPQPLIPAAAGTSPYGVAIGDFNGDGRPDLVTANEGVGNVASLTVLVNNGHGYSQQVMPSNEVFTGTEFGGYGGIAAGDLNGDGRADFVVTNGGADSMTVFMSTNTRAGLGFTQTTIPTDGSPDQVAIGHVNSSDGAQDIVIGDQQGNADLFTNTTPQLGLGLGG